MRFSLMLVSLEEECLGQPEQDARAQMFVPLADDKRQRLVELRSGALKLILPLCR